MRFFFGFYGIFSMELVSMESVVGVFLFKCSLGIFMGFLFLCFYGFFCGFYAFLGLWTFLGFYAFFVFLCRFLVSMNF